MYTLSKSIILFLALSILTHAVETTFKPQPEQGNIHYLLFTPEITSGKKYPLVIFLHGAGERGNDNKSQLKHGARVFTTAENQAKRPCFVIAPQCPKDQWWSGKNLEDVITIVEKFAKDPRVDTSRIYITGLSMGGFGTWSIIAQRPKLFAAAIPICGGGNPADAKTIKHIPIRAYHGDADKVVTPDKSQSMIDALKSFRAKDATLTLYPNVGHDSWTQTYVDPSVMAWLFEQSL
jgi:predicted peptidase